MDPETFSNAEIAKWESEAPSPSVIGPFDEWVPAPGRSPRPALFEMQAQFVRRLVRFWRVKIHHAHGHKDKEKRVRHSGFKSLLRDQSLRAFLWTQFLGAFNDNVYKIVVSMRAVHVAADSESSSLYLSLAGAVFVVPFLLFSGYTGHLAEAISKGSVLIGVKIFEIFVMGLGLAAFFSTRIELMLLVLFLMALHSTIFSPAKYGIVPEILPDADLSRANALLEMSTFTAIVLGTSVGSFLFSTWKNEPWNMGLVMATHTLFRIRIVGQQNVPFRGPALLVANHMSHIDGFLIGACLQRFVRFMVWKPLLPDADDQLFFRLTKAIPVGAGGPRDVVASIHAARKELEAGHVVCIFAEGAISRTGNTLPFRRGLEKIVANLGVPVIPVHLDRLWGSIFSFERGRFLWKWPKRVPYPVTVSFGVPMLSTVSAHQVRQAILELGSDAVAHSKQRGDRLDLQMIRTARRHWNKFAMADSSGRQLTFGRTLTGSLLIARWINKERPAEKIVGLLLPPSVGGALANVGVTIAGRASVNLNFTAGREAILSSIAQCGLRTIITSKVFLERAKIEAPEGSVFLEDVLSKASRAEKIITMLVARSLPARLLAARYGHSSCTPDSLATVIFSSGSSGSSERRHAVTPQCSVEHPRHGTGVLGQRSRSYRGYAAVFPLLWIHRHHLATPG